MTSLVFGYGSSSEDDAPKLLRPPETAPDVTTLGLSLLNSGAVVSTAATRNLQPASVHVIRHNPKAEDLYAPVAGPSHPYRKEGVGGLGERNHPLGFVESAHIGDFAFQAQHHTFNAWGFGAEPSGDGWVGDAAAAGAHDGASVFETRPGDRKRKGAALLSQAAGSGDGGAWAAAAARAPAPLADHGALSAEQREYVAWHNARREARRKKPAADGDGAAGGSGAGAEEAASAEPVTGGEKSHFHGKSATNYAGDSWLAPPKDRKKENDVCYAPKRWVHTWAGHAQGTAAIRFFPGHGHLLLSAGMDAKVKIWDVHGSGKCMRTYMGHSGAVKDVCFSADGRRFVSASFDKDVKVWDTETGQVVVALTAGCVPNCVRLHPDKQHVLLAGLADRRVAQWDVSTGDLTQEYTEHLAGVNALTFVDDGRRFVSSSDDKTLRVWEFGIPVTIKYIADPAMHSMPALALHPSGAWLAAQSMDNQVVIYSTKERFRLNAKKHFAGHTNAGFACQVGFSPDGKFVLSGDGDGRMFIWDWKTSRILRTIKCHDKVCIGVEWHPLEASRVATCSWKCVRQAWNVARS